MPTMLELFSKFFEKMKLEYPKDCEVFEYNGQRTFVIWNNSRKFKMGFDIELGYLVWKDIEILYE